MRVLRYAAEAGHSAPHCVIMLPAAFCAAEDFVQEGFVAAARARCLPLDLLFVQPEARHVTDRSVLRQLQEQVVRPARAAGAAVWLGGISLGGYLALGYAERHAAELAGLCLLAPYLGSHLVTGEIERAGGLAAWEPGKLGADDEERRLWRFIKQRDQQPAMHLGLGRDDRFAHRHLVLARALPPADVDSVPGGHDWPTWRKLWDNFLVSRLSPP